MNKFKLQAPFEPTGDQPAAIVELEKGLKKGKKHQVLLGATGTGKTFTIANIIQKVQKPTLVLAHNKTLCAQLAAELREFFPDNAVDYFVSYYDYYQPEAYVPSSDTYIEKETQINEEIDKFRHASTTDLLTRKDVIIVASVSCIYGLGSPEEYLKSAVKVVRGQEIKRDDFLRKLINIQYRRNDTGFTRGTFRVRGEVVEVAPVFSENAYRFEFFGDEVENITETDILTGEIYTELQEVIIPPAKHTITNPEVIERITPQIKKELKLRLAELKANSRLVEAQRLEQRTNYDLEMLNETGYVNGIENYSMYLSDNKPGEPAPTLLDFFPDDFLLVVDESHMSIPQIGGMYEGNRSRKNTLIEYGFRLPSARENRPLKFNEFMDHINQAIYISATPRPWEIEMAGGKVVEQIIRPTGLLDPVVEVKPSKNQIDDIVENIHQQIKNGERTLITTITKKMAEDLAEYLSESGIKVKYMHSDTDTFERIEIIRELRTGDIDVLVGINLLREGLDLPEVSYIAILDADKQGFLRSRDALIQIIGRTARNVHGRVTMYADQMTTAMKEAISETNRRRAIQEKYNQKHGITPTTIFKKIADIGYTNKHKSAITRKVDQIPLSEITDYIKLLNKKMDLASMEMRFEDAADYRDEIESVKKKYKV